MAQEILEIERRRNYDAVLAHLRAYRATIDQAILTLEWLQKADRSKICRVDLSNAPGLQKVLEDGKLSETQQAALNELEKLANPSANCLTTEK